MSCDCCDNGLQHLIRGVLARYDAPIPPPTRAAIIAELKEGLREWEAEQLDAALARRKVQS